MIEAHSSTLNRRSTNLKGPAQGESFRLIQIPNTPGVLTIQSAGGRGNLDLYLAPPARQARFSRSRASHRSTGRGNRESIRVVNPGPGPWRLLLHGRTRYSGASLVVSFRPNQPSGPVQTPGLQLSLLSSGTDYADLAWSYSGDLARVHEVQLSLRNLRTNVVEGGVPVSYLPRRSDAQQVNGLASGTRYRATLQYRGKAGFAGAAANLEFETAAGPEVPPDPRLLSVAGSPEGLDCSWSWPGDSATISRIELSVVNRATNERVFSTNLPATRRDAAVTGLEPNTDHILSVTYVARNGERSTASAHFATARLRVVVLLHGLFSNRTVWDSFIRSKHPQGYLTSGTVYGGAVHNVAPALNGVRYYTMNFGSKDVSHGRPGVDGLAPFTSSGDFSSFAVLGEEVQGAVRAILGRHDGAEIVLVGHSRGGLAARAFLQSAAPERSAVVGLVTTGTPHQGTPFGRIYEYLRESPRAGLPHSARRSYAVNRNLAQRQLLTTIILPEGFSPLFRGWANQGAHGSTGFGFLAPGDTTGRPSRPAGWGYSAEGSWYDIAQWHGAKPRLSEIVPWSGTTWPFANNAYWQGTGQQTEASFFPFGGGTDPELEVRRKDHRTWHVVDTLRSEFDARKTSVGDLASGSVEIARLNAGIASLPSQGIKYRVLYYDSGHHLGAYTILETPVVSVLKWLSPTAQNYIFGQGKDASDWKGDGVVPTAYQRLPSHLMPRGAHYQEVRGSGFLVLHTEQPQQTADLDRALREIAPWW